jgi:hypothetical protein
VIVEPFGGHGHLGRLGPTLSDQSRDIAEQLVQDSSLDEGLKDGLLQKLAAYPQDPARALLEHLMAVREQPAQAATSAEGAA